MTYRLDFRATAEKTWRKLGATVRDQFHKKLLERLEPSGKQAMRMHALRYPDARRRRIGKLAPLDHLDFVANLRQDPRDQEPANAAANDQCFCHDGSLATPTPSVVSGTT